MAYTKDEASRLVIEAGLKLIKEGLIARTWGNISARLSGETFLITPSGRAYDSLTPDDLVEVKIKDCSYEGDIKPSSEKGVHAAVYAQRPEAEFVIHAHSNNASAISILQEDIKFTRFESDLPGGVIPTARYAMTSTDKLVRHVATVLKRHPKAKAMLLPYHGTLCYGGSFEEAMDVTRNLEKTAGTIFERRTGDRIKPYNLKNNTLYKGSFGGKDFETHVIQVKTPFVMEMSLRGKDLPIFIEDMAQMVGSVIRCKDVMGRKKFIIPRSARGKRSATLVKGEGAFVTAPDREEAEALAILLEKQCQAADLGLKKGIRPLSSGQAALEHYIYVNKYSKQKDQNNA
ncbi:MAG: class II aldolase/adducin family protein [Clostridia bacterium]|nr:class II aldolase/adducin family protein [Clostridia bacterium]